MGYRFDAGALVTDTIGYTNAAGFRISITRLQFYLSDFKLLKTDGSTYPINQAYYFDAKNPSFNAITLKDIPVGNYTGITFYVGLDSVLNKPLGLPATVENNNMEWPMGNGGYHFMKMEGYFVDSNVTQQGYTMHLGENANLVPVSLPNKPFTIGALAANIQLKMNVNEWYKNPTIYDFNKDGNFSMGNAAAMAKLKLNGSDVFNE